MGNGFATLTVIGLKYESFYREQARKRQATLSGGSNPQLLQNSAEAEKGNAMDKLGKMVGVSRDTLKKVKELDAGADEGTKEQLRKGEVSIHKAYSELKNREHEGETRVCACCGLEKPFSDYRIPSNRNDYRPICKACEAKAKQAAKEAEEATAQRSSAASVALADIPSSVSGIAIKDGKLAHVMTGLPDDNAAFGQVVHMLQSAQNYYIAAFRGIIDQYRPAMITQEHNELLQSMLDNTADTVDDLFTDHIKEDK